MKAFNILVSHQDNNRSNLTIMELPLHYDLDVFEEYYTDYLKEYGKDTLMQVVKTDSLIDYYSYFVSEKGDVITFKNEYNVYVNGKIETKNINDIVFIITNTVGKYLKERIENYVEINDDSLKEFIIYITKHYEGELEYLTAIIAKSEYSGRFYEFDLRLVDFIITHLRCWYGRYFLNKFSENSKIEIVKIFRFLKNKKVENNQTTQPKLVEIPELKTEPNNKGEVSIKIQNLSLEAFLGNSDTLYLFKYLCENFYGSGARFTELTKYNQIFFFLNYQENLPKEPFKKLVNEIYGFNYGNSEIKGETKKHQTTLNNLSKLYKEQK